MPRYARRTREVDEAILGTYLSGANSRRIRKALKPLLGEEHLSKSAVSRVVSRLKECFEEWQNRDLSEEVYAIVYLDGFHMKVRMAKRVISVPVLAALGVTPDGQKRLLSLRLAVSEASTHWSSMLEGLQAQGLRAPKLLISDGHKGLTKALEKWPGSYRHSLRRGTSTRLSAPRHPRGNQNFPLVLRRRPLLKKKNTPRFAQAMDRSFRGLATIGAVKHFTGGLTLPPSFPASRSASSPPSSSTADQPETTSAPGTETPHPSGQTTPTSATPTSLLAPPTPCVRNPRFYMIANKAPIDHKSAA